MKKLTAKEIIAKLEEEEIFIEDFAYDCPDHGYDELYSEGIEVSEAYSEKFDRVKEELGGWKEVAQKGGEGQGDEWYSVKYFPAHDVYIRTDGWYTSYHGTDFEDVIGYEVKPQEKVITVYE
jgi:hypothetical protein